MDKQLDYICHWGIKGMRWGVRKSDEPVTSKERISYRNNQTELRKQKEENRMRRIEMRAKNAETEKNRNLDIDAQRALNQERRKNLDQVAKFISSVTVAGLLVYRAVSKNRKASGKSIKHSGIKGMKWGIRRFQNEDGSLTEAGKARYKILPDGTVKKLDSREMTDDELNRSNMRLSKEEEYNRHTGNKSRNAGYKKNIAEKTAASALASFALTSATSFLMNKSGKNKLEGKDLAKRSLANGLFAAGTTAIATFATATAGANAVTNTKVDEAYKRH